MDQNDDKRKTTERHLRGARRYEERKENLILRKRRGHRPPSRMRDLSDDDLDFEDTEFDDPWIEEHPKPRSPRAHGNASHASAPRAGTPARVSSIARTEIRALLPDGTERVARVTPRVQAQGGLVVGDRVTLDASDRVVARDERRTLLERRDPGNRHRTRLLAANVDVGLVVLAPRSDGLSLGFLDRAIAALESGGIEPCITVTKADLLATEQARSALRETLAPWIRAGTPVHLVGSPTGEGIAPLRELLSGRVTVLVGHSGVGKSTLVNALDPTATQATGATRDSDGRGRHTTTSSRLIPFLEGGALVDTPGIRQLAPDVTRTASLAAAIPELGPYLGTCRFPDCAHAGEPGCALEDAAATAPDVAEGLRRLRRLLSADDD